MIGYTLRRVLPKIDKCERFSVLGKAIRKGSSSTIKVEFNGGRFNRPVLFDLNSNYEDARDALNSVKFCEKSCKCFIIACREPGLQRGGDRD